MAGTCIDSLEPVIASDSNLESMFGDDPVDRLHAGRPETVTFDRIGFPINQYVKVDPYQVTHLPCAIRCHHPSVCSHTRVGGHDWPVNLREGIVLVDCVDEDDPGFTRLPGVLGNLSEDSSFALAFLPRGTAHEL